MLDKREVKQERTGWRDEPLSKLHRQWGYDCPAVDIDFLLLEYDNNKAVALVEYKHQNSPSQTKAKSVYRALIDLGDRADIMVFNCRYSDDFSNWAVTPLNKKAKEVLPQHIKNMSQLEWVRFLYGIRGHEVPKSILDNLEKECKISNSKELVVEKSMPDQLIERWQSEEVRAFMRSRGLK